MWHQGDGDTYFASSSCYAIGDYANNLNTIINNVRTHYGNGSGLGWVVSKVSLTRGASSVDKITNSSVIAGQTSVAIQGGSYFHGPATDDVGIPRLPESNEYIHFRNDNLDDLAVAWYNSISSSGNILDNNSNKVNPIVARQLMNINVSQVGSSYNISPQIPSGFNSYHWDDNGYMINYDSNDANTSTITVSNDPFKRNYRIAYFYKETSFSDDEFNTAISVPFRALGSYFSNDPNARIASSEDNESITTTYINNEVIVFPNPSYEEVNIKVVGNEMGWEKVEIFSDTGAPIYTSKFDGTEQSTFTIDNKVFNKTGFYVIKIYRMGKMETKRIYIEK